MPDINFPTLSVKPNTDWQEDMPDDPVFRSKFESGNVNTRLRFTRSLSQKTIVYAEATAADKALVEAFAISCGWGALSFNWTNPITEAVEVVKLAKPPSYKLKEGEAHWDINIVIKDA